jgi:hypothetical protein
VKAFLSLLIIRTCVTKNYCGKKLLTRGKKTIKEVLSKSSVVCEKNRESVLPHGFLGDVIVVKGMHTSGGV